MTRRRSARGPGGAGRVVATLAVAAFVSAGCSSSHATTTATTSTSGPSTTSTTLDPRADAALKVWTDYARVSADWLNPPDPADPRIATLIADSSVEKFREQIAMQKVKNLATRPGPNGPPQHHPRVSSASAQQVVIRDCFVDDTVTYDLRSGSTVDAAVVTLTLDATLVPEAGAWKVLRIDQVSKFEGTGSCA